MGRKRKKQKTQKRPKIETKVAQFLDGLKLNYQQNYRIDKYSVDFFVEGRYIIECYGDFWHCNPKKYEPDYYNKGLKCEAKKRWRRDSERQWSLEAMGYPMLVLWESQINSNAKSCKSKILRHLGRVDKS